MGRIRSAYPNRRSRMTARLGSFLLKVESGAETAVARAWQRLRARKPTPEATTVDGAGERGAEDGRASVAQGEPVAAAAVAPPMPQARSDEPATLREPELPRSYGRSRVVVLAIDPYHVHAYWEVTPQDVESARSRSTAAGPPALTWVLRFYDVTRVAADTACAHEHFDVAIELEARNWYIDLWSPDKTYLVELGALVSGEFVGLCRAAPVTVPAAQLSLPQVPEWRTADPERATTHPVPASDPRVPQTPSWRASPASAVAPPFAAEQAPSFTGEQPWVAATRGFDGAGVGGMDLGEGPPTSKAPETQAATPQALASERSGLSAAHSQGAAGAGERSRSISLPSVAPVSGGSFDRGGGQGRTGASSA